MKETTHQRYKRVLEEIASGMDNASALAADALISRKPIGVDKSQIEARKVHYQQTRQAIKARNLDIFMRREWGEPISMIAARYEISPGRVQGILAGERQLARFRAPRCIRCGHSGSMHHDPDWNYNTGPCAEYLCECTAMDGGHD